MKWLPGGMTPGHCSKQMNAAYSSRRTSVWPSPNRHKSDSQLGCRLLKLPAIGLTVEVARNFGVGRYDFEVVNLVLSSSHLLESFVDATLELFKNIAGGQFFNLAR